PLRSLSVAFIGPAEPGPAVLEGTVLRAGRSVTQVEVRLRQSGEARAAAFASFGEDRVSAVNVTRDDRPRLPVPDGIAPLRPVPGVTPEFFGRFELRFAAGAPRFSGASEPDFGGWMRFSEPPAVIGERELVVLADAWPPAVAPLLRGPVPASTV